MEEWQFCIEVFDPKSRIGCLSTHDSKAVLNSILYQIRTEAPWRNLPKSYPPAKNIPFQAIHSVPSLAKKWFLVCYFKNSPVRWLAQNET